MEGETNEYLDYLLRGNWFTLDSVFNNVKADYDLQDGETVTWLWEHMLPEQRRDLLLAFVRRALAELAENDCEGVRLAAARAHHLHSNSWLDFAVVPDMYAALETIGVPAQQLAELAPAPDAAAYIAVPNCERIIIMTPDWLVSAVTRPLQALAYFIRAASLARDDYFGLLRGVQYVGLPGFAMAEVSNYVFCLCRAQALMSEVLNQALENDQRIFQLTPKISPELYQIRDHVPRAANCPSLMYADPPRRRDDATA